MTAEFTRLTITGGVARLTLCRPAKRNALTRQFLQELLQAVETVRSDATVRCLLLAAEGPVFCAGMDLGEMEQRARASDADRQWQQDTDAYRELLEALFGLPMPTIAVLQGPVLAGGVGLVLACDIVLASESAFFALPEPKRGITAAVVTPLLAYRIGPGQAGYVLLSGDNVSAEDALRMGLCHLLVPPEELQPRTDSLLASLLEGAPSALRLTKTALRECTAELISSQLEAAGRISAQARSSDEAREGLAAFLEKRKPEWRNSNDQ